MHLSRRALLCARRWLGFFPFFFLDVSLQVSGFFAEAGPFFFFLFAFAAADGVLFLLFWFLSWRVGLLRLFLFCWCRGSA